MTDTTNTTSTQEVPITSGETPIALLPTPSPEPSKSVTPPKQHAPSPAEVVGIDLNVIGKAEARKIMSEEHKALGFRPPHGSLAAEAQAAAAKHPQITLPNAHPPPIEKLKEAAREDAARILAQRKPEDHPEPHHPTQTQPHHPTTTKTPSPLPSPSAPLAPALASIAIDPAFDLNTISEADARRLMSHEHRALGFRPPPGSLAAEAQAAASKHPHPTGHPESEVVGKHSVKDDVLREAAWKDAERIKMTRELEENGDQQPPKKSPRSSSHSSSHKSHSEGSGSPPSESKPQLPILPPIVPEEEEEEEEEVIESKTTISETTNTEEILKITPASVTSTTSTTTEETTKIEANIPETPLDTPEIIIETLIPSTTSQSLQSLESSESLEMPGMTRSETGDSIQIIGDVLA